MWTLIKKNSIRKHFFNFVNYKKSAEHKKKHNAWELKTQTVVINLKHKQVY